MKKYIVLLAVCLVSFYVSAQESFKGLKPIAQPILSDMDGTLLNAILILPPRIIVSENYKQMELQNLSVETEIVGNVATTTYDMVFYNPNGSVLEGEFIFPLTDAQNVSAIALDIDGKMREGVVVEKQKARQTFEAVIRQELDPMLAEKTSGNQFKTRVYPLPAKGTRRIRVTLEESLSTKNGAYYYNLPLKFDTKIDSFSLNMQIGITDKEAPIPQIKSGLKDFAFKSEQNGLRAHFSAENYLLDTDISFDIPKTDKPAVFTHKKEGQTYFYTDVEVNGSAADKVLPGKITIVWDTSLSGSKRNIEDEKKLLSAYLTKIGTVDIEFVTFNLAQTNRKNITIKNGDVTALMTLIDSIVYDGATRFDGLKLSNEKSDEILLFTDGIGTYGKTQLTPPNKPTYVVNSASEYERGHLQKIAQKSGGVVVNLKALNTDEALNKLLKKPLRVLNYKTGASVNEIYPSVGTPVENNLTFAGIVRGNSADIEVEFGYAPNQVTQTQKVHIPDGMNNSAVERLWAGQKIRELEMDSKANKSAILELGEQYSIVTDNTSLLVLDNVEDYVRYNIEPPVELRPQYNRLISMQQKEMKESQQTALEETIEMADEVKKWWKTNYKLQAQYEKLKNKLEGAFEGLEYGSSTSSGPYTPGQFGDTLYGGDGGSSNGSGSVQTMDKSLDEDKPSNNVGRISIQAWDPQTPYLKILKKSGKGELYQDYLMLKKGYDDQPSFYFDVSDEFKKQGQEDKALIILSNVAEMQLDNPELLRIAANKLMELKQYPYAIDLFEQVVELRGEDPQSYRYLALAYQSAGQYQKAFDTFYYILKTKWDRFKEIKQVVFVEMNNLLAAHPEINVGDMPKTLIFKMPVDMRIVLGWSTDNTDIDLYVISPDGVSCYYGNRLTPAGMRYAFDFRGGYGPEEIMMKKAPNGVYKIKTNNFGNTRQNVSGPTTLYLDLYTHYGTQKQKHERILVRTENVKEDNVIGEITFTD